MTLLILGLVVFLGIHTLPMFTTARAALVQKLGENGYKGAFTIFSLIGLGLIIWGKSVAPFEAVYAPPAWGRAAAVHSMPIAFILLAAANMPGHIRRVLKHPMLIATILWATVHLCANGDRASILLFGAIGAWAVIDLISEISRGKVLVGKPPAFSRDVMAVVGGGVVYMAVMHGHAWLFGVAVV